MRQQWTYTPRQQPSFPRAPSPPQAYYTDSILGPPPSPHSPHSSWLLDSGASQHISTDLQNLSMDSEYDGTDEIAVGNGHKLPITHTGITALFSPSTTFLLRDVLCVSKMTCNLLSISQLCKINHVSVEFLPTGFLVKDLRTGTVLLQGPFKGATYEWPVLASPISGSSTAFSTVKMSLQDWHHTLSYNFLLFFSSQFYE